MYTSPRPEPPHYILHVYMYVVLRMLTIPGRRTFYLRLCGWPWNLHLEVTVEDARWRLRSGPPSPDAPCALHIQYLRSNCAHDQ